MYEFQSSQITAGHLYMHGIRRTKSRNNDRTSNRSIGRNGGVSGRQMIYHLRP